MVRGGGTVWRREGGEGSTLSREFCWFDWNDFIQLEDWMDICPHRVKLFEG